MVAMAAVDFFDTQFQRQVAAHEFELNPFERASLPFLGGSVLDFGCGLGNLSIEAARRGCPVLALDASPTAVAHLQAMALGERLPIQVQCVNLRDYAVGRMFDCVVSIGLLHFLDREHAERQLSMLQSCVLPGGMAAINVLTEGTTYLDLFDAGSRCLFEVGELAARFAGWDIVHDEASRFEGPQGTRKQFSTVVARRRILP